ncbi:MAG: hypothetical protein K0R29_2151 [Pseudobdellovibrio sp.]|nr:hypothetical protein [Pseudobdellovibrio sp.]
MKIVLSIVVVIATALIFTNCSPSSTTVSSDGVCPTLNFAYAVDTSNNLLCFSLSKLNTSTGAASAVGPTYTFTGATNFAADFNPVADRLRIVTNNQLNQRLQIASSTTLVDTPVNYDIGDPNQGQTPNITAVAYTNNVSGTVSTTLYDIDSTLDILATQNPPNAGTLTTVGALGVDTGANTSFDIQTVSGTNTAYLVVTPTSGIFSTLYTVDLATGNANLVNVIAGGSAIRAFSVAP